MPKPLPLDYIIAKIQPITNQKPTKMVIGYVNHEYLSEQIHIQELPSIQEHYLNNKIHIQELSSIQELYLNNKIHILELPSIQEHYLTIKSIYKSCPIFQSIIFEIVEHYNLNNDNITGEQRFWCQRYFNGFCYL